MPSNAISFFAQLMKIASFDFINLEPILNKILNLKPTGPLQYLYGEIGFSSTLFINNLGTFFVIFVGYTILLTLLKLTDLCKISDKIYQVKTYLREKLLYNFLIRTLFESSSQIATCCFINFKQTKWTSVGYGIHNLSAIFFFMLLIIFPIVLCFHLS